MKFITRRQLAMMMLTVTVASAAGCWEERVIRDDFATLRAMGEQHREPKDKKGRQNSQGELGYGIVLASFDGDDRNDKARKLMYRLRRDANINDVRLLDQGNQTLVYRGPYDDPSTELTRRDVESTRAITLDGKRPFSMVGMTALWAGAEGAPTHPLDLRRFPGAYTLQVAYFDEASGPEFRKSAEAAAAELRKNDEEAFFYHGPIRSLVTIGVFGDEDVVRLAEKDEKGVNHIKFTYSPRVLELQEKYPWNVVNGMKQTVDADGKPVARQRSSLVRVSQ